MRGPTRAEEWDKRKDVLWLLMLGIRAEVLLLLLTSSSSSANASSSNVLEEEEDDDKGRGG